MKKTTKIIVKIGAFILIGGILWIGNGFVGNPISKFLANSSAKTYIAETYPGMEIEREKAIYNFKSGGYYVLIKSPTSIDTHFVLNITPIGDIRSDSYEYDVLGKFNTWNRVNADYRKMVDSVFDSDDFFYESNIGYGNLKLKEKDLYRGFGESYGLNLEELELDKIYDIKELGETSGNIVLYIEDEEINVNRASEILLHIKDVFDKKDVPFYAIDFTLQEPRTEDKKRFEDTERFNVAGFLYEDINEEGLIQRLERAAKDLADYYEKEDSKKEKFNY